MFSSLKLLHCGILRYLPMPDKSATLPAAFHTDLQGEYAEFLQHEPSVQALVAQSKKAIMKLRKTPLISVVMPVYRPIIAYYEQALASVFRQTYPHWELILVHDGRQPDVVLKASHQAAESSDWVRIVHTDTHGGISAATNAGVHEANGEYVAFLDHDDLLRPHALERLVTAMQTCDRSPDFVYSDHDKIDTEGRRYEPEFKPDWSPEAILAHCYIGHLKMIKRELFLRLGGMRSAFDSAQDYDLFLRMAEQTDAVIHVPEILYHWRSVPGSTALGATEKPRSIELGQQAVQQALERRQKRGAVKIPGFARQYNVGVYAIEYAPCEFTEHVTIVIPTKDRADLLRTCIDSVHMHTQYPHYDILVINNNSVEPETAQYLNRADVKHIDIQTDSFNFSHLMNAAANHAKGDYLLLLNNDTEVLHDGWLTAMMGTALLDDRIGAVGAKLLYNDNTVQHAGVVLGPNNTTAGHANKALPADESGYGNSLRAMRNYSVVTAACLLTPKQAFERVGGFNENKLPVSYNDVDYCLKLIAQGYRVAYTPNAVLRHHEAETRKHDHCEQTEYEARTYLRRVWQPLLRHDPYYNPNLSVADGCFHMRKRPPGKSILFASHNLEYQGASLFLFELARVLHEKDYHVEVTAPCDGPLAQQYAKANIPLHIQQPGQPHPLHQMNKDAFDILFLNTITTFNLLEGLDVHAHPLVWCIHESEREVYQAKHAGLNDETFRQISDVLFVAQATKNMYADVLHGHSHVIHNGIDIAAIDAGQEMADRNTMRQENGYTETETVISCIGTLCERKGQYELLETFEALHHKDSSLRLLLVGNFADEAYETKVREYVQKHRLTDRVRLVPATPNIYRYYAMTDIFVCNSFIESFPRVTLEAMAAQLPVVATNVFGIPEQMQNGTDGLLVEPGNATALQNAILRLKNNPELAAKLAENARRRVQQEFGIETMVRQYEELFTTIAGR